MTTRSDGRPILASPAERALRFLLLAACILPALVFAVAAAIAYRHQFSEANDRLLRTLDVVHEHAVKVFETIELVQLQIADATADLEDSEIRTREKAIHLRLKLLADALDQISGIYVFDASGAPLAAANRFPVPATPNASAREYFAAHRDGLVPPGKRYVSESLRSLADGATEFFIVSASRPGTAADPQRFRGVVAISVEPRYFKDFYAGVRQAGLDTLAIIRSDGSILARHPGTSGAAIRVPAGSGFMIATGRDPERGSYEVPSAVDQVPRLYAYRRLPNLPVYATAGIDRATILAEWRATMGSHLLFGVPATAGLVLLSAIALRRTRQEAAALARLQDEVARREATEDQLRQAQKMEAIGRLTGGLAHDFNNLLTIVVGSLDLVSRRGLADPRGQRLVDSALDGANRAARLTQRLLAFSRQQPLDPKPVDVNRAIGEMAEIVRRTLGETIRCETVLAGGVWRTIVDRNALESALLNLAVNARDAMEPAGGRLTIETGNAHLDEAYAAHHPEMVPGQYVQVAVTDTGCGMPPSVVARAFDPFFTTKEAGKGTGLGLSQVYGFAKQSGGHAAIYSEEGRGTTVKLYLPRYLGTEGEEPSRPEPAAEPADGTRTILLVEDDDAVRAFAEDALRDLGYRVLVADGAESALRQLAADASVSLLLTDVVMPDMDGRRLADEVLKRRPDLTVVFMTGYTRNAIVHNGVLDRGTHLIAKPFTQGQLAAKLRAALTSRGA